MAVSPQDKLVLDARPALEIVPPITTKESVVVPSLSGNNFKTSVAGAEPKKSAGHSFRHRRVIFVNPDGYGLKPGTSVHSL